MIYISVILYMLVDIVSSFVLRNVGLLVGWKWNSYVSRTG